jgi:DivIVA domain-containing protein
MEEKTLQLTREDILKAVFTPNVKGYDPVEVDSFLDRVIADYATYDQYVSETKNYIESLEKQLRTCKDKNQQLELDLAKYQTRLNGIRDSDSVSAENLQLLQRCRKMESALYKAGIDPTKL